MLFLVLVYVFNFNLFEFSAAILEKGQLPKTLQLVLCACDKVDTVPVEITYNYTTVNNF